MTTVAAALVRALEANGVELVFGIPGTHNLELYRGLAASGIRHVTPRHEQGAGYAADGYARVAGKPGVVITTSGPGLTNALTALATSYADSVPVLVVSPGPPLGMERAGVGWLHEMKDQRASVDAAVARSVRCETGARAIAAVHETFARWAVERPRPVHLEIPVDVLESAWEGPEPPVLPRAEPPAPAAASLARAAALLDAAQHPVIIAGAGAQGAAAELAAVAEALDAPVVTSAAGKGVLDERHRLSVGVFLRSPDVHALVRECDALLVVGSELSVAETGDRVLEPGGPVVRVDLEAEQLHKNLPAQVPVLADARAALAALITALTRAGAPRRGAERAGAARERCRTGVAAFAPASRAVQDAITAVLPADAVMVGDSSQVSYLGTGPFWPASAPGRHLRPTGFATLGYGLPAAIGAKLAAPERAVVVLLGDGALMFSVQELQTAAEHEVPIVVVVVDNGGYAEIRRGMQDRGIPLLAVDLQRPDFVALAGALGATGKRAADVTELGRLVACAVAAPGPTLLVIDEDAVRAGPREPDPDPHRPPEEHLP